ncbi:MAG: hypothetical protein M3O09_08325 [Acidobacteriota bacterium]|nr:hypothetical protein [Acidobacteriota bacterium]
MPLARVITGIEQYSAELTLQLQKQGFEVQTSSARDVGSKAPDLEITLNRCAPEAAGSLIGSSASTGDMCVFVTPQAMAGIIRSIDIFVLTSQTADEVHPEVPAAVLMPEVFGSRIAAHTSTSKVVPIDGGITSEMAPLAISPQSLQESPKLSSVPSGPPATAPLPLFVAQEQREDSSLVPHGMIWQASGSESSEEAARSETYSEVFAEDGNDFTSHMRALSAKIAKFAAAGSRPFKRYQESFVSSNRRKTPVAARLSVAAPQRRNEISEQARRRDARLWNAMAMAVTASLLALAAVSLAGKYLPSQNPSAASPVAVGNSRSPIVKGASEVPAAPLTNVATAAPSPKLSVARIPAPPSVRSNRPGVPRASVVSHSRQPKTGARRNPDSDYVAKDTTIYYNRGVPSKRLR